MPRGVPRRLPPNDDERQSTIDKTGAAGSGRGQSPSYRPPRSGTGNQQGRGQQAFDEMDPVVIGLDAASTSGRAVAVGAGSQANFDHSTALGADSTADGGAAISIGHFSSATGDAALAVGSAAGANGMNTVALGRDAYAEGDQAIALGSATAEGANSTAIQGIAHANGAVAIGADHAGATAHALNQDEFVLGTSAHIVIVHGKLVLDDGTGGLWQLSVSTGGVLSVVAYP